MSFDADRLYSVMESIVAPALIADGAELFVTECTPTRVALHVRGRYAGCPGNSLAFRNVIEPALLAASSQCRVTVSSGELLPEGARPWSEVRAQLERP